MAEQLYWCEAMAVVQPDEQQVKLCRGLWVEQAICQGDVSPELPSCDPGVH